MATNKMRGHFEDEQTLVVEAGHCRLCGRPVVLTASPPKQIAVLLRSVYQTGSGCSCGAPTIPVQA
jgi:hypothetical protein